MAKSDRLNPTQAGKATLADHKVRWAPKGNQPLEVSGLLRDDPTFEEFHKILQQQRHADYQQTNADVDLLS
ncbi:MAG: hypothetical protein ETSY2_41765 [Candidatus Entotheonella gemina]|uniref:Uncharacterized protein n=1 Tax=Candidatus Entotheonella gemina TaxID=1429439 RepID=W4LMR5_9BACT|nr:MAG: hypothetical protein ETSY2_41765 [Candidatus Entotheonella gemina]